MAKLPGTPALVVNPAKVIAVYEDTRTLDVQWLSLPTTKRGVIFVGQAGNYSLPKVGDAGIVIGNGMVYYYLGNIEYNYTQKIAGSVPDDLTGVAVSHKKVSAGELHITNVLQQVWLNIANNGDFSLFNGLLEGFKYLRSLRLVQVFGKTIDLMGNGVRVSVGNAIRNIPATGQKPVAGTSGGKALEILMQVAYQSVQTVRLHLGELTDLVTGATPELGSWGQRLKAVLEVTLGPAPLAALKIDELGNIELSSTTGQIGINSGSPASIHLGGTNPPALHALALGDLLLTWLNTHTHPSPTGPTGVPITPAPATLLSTKVFTN